jgi:hypothetical protein
MRVILFVFLALLLASSAGATEPTATPIEPDDTLETIAITGSTLFALGNVMTIALKTPSYWLGGLSIGVGAATMLLTVGDHPHEAGLWVSSVSAVAAGGIALIYRHALDQPERHARLEPSWSNGASGLAFVVDF